MSAKKDILLIGGGGHCISCIEVIESLEEYNIVGIIDKEERIGEKILDYHIIGCDDDLENLRTQYHHALITVGQVKNSHVRSNLFTYLNDLNYTLPKIIAKTATVSKYSSVGKGSIVMHGAFINANTKVGNNCIVNSFALIEHDCSIGDHTHVSTRASLNGNVTVGNDCFIGSTTCVNNNVVIPDGTVLGSNATVIKNIETAGVYVGSPVKKVN